MSRSRHGEYLAKVDYEEATWTRRWFTTLTALILILPVAALGNDQGWPHFRGPDYLGSSLGNHVLDRAELGLAVAWRRPLGSGYSSVLVAEGSGVTMFTDGTDDYLTAFDPHTGEELWRYRIAEMYAGHTGSDDGPLSTPAVRDGTVYGLGPRGHLFAVSLADGRELWSHVLDGETESRQPDYGYATAPLVVGDVVVVQTGGPGGRSITAFDRRDGQRRWSVEDDAVNYQSPALAELGGQTQLLALNNKYLLGLDPATGEVLWKHEHQTLPTEAFTQPQGLGRDRVLINSVREVVALRVTPQGGSWKIEELWRSNAFRHSYAVPVYHGGYLFGFNSRFLTCIAADGEVKWKSRPPGGRGLILVDGRLVILGDDGDVVVAEASPQRYREAARVPVFERGGMTPPSFAEGRIYVRNLEEMASIDVTETAQAVAETPQAAAEKERELLGSFGQFVRRVEVAEDPAALVDDYLGARESYPIIEGEDLVHFVYQGEVADVALSGNFLPWRAEAVMDRIAGTNVYFKSMELDPEAIWEYRFSLDFGERSIADPKNPHTIGATNPSSILRMPRSKAPLEIEEAPVEQRGRLDSFQLRSDVRGNERRLRLYLPSGYERSGQMRYPLLVVFEGFGSALDHGHMDRWLDRLIAGGRMEPVVVVFVTEVGGHEYRGEDAADFVRLLTEELLPYLEKHYRIRPDGAGALGTRLGARAAVNTAFMVPGTFGKIALQTPVIFGPLSGALLELVRTSEKQDLELLVELRRHDLVLRGVDLAAATESFVAAFEDTGYTVRRREVPGSWGWSSWRAQWGDILAELYPAAKENQEEADGTP